MKEKICQGFLIQGVSAGIKKKQEKDLGIIYSKVPAKIAGVFTQNQVKAAPVLLDMERVKLGSGRAIIVNSGNANCCTGGQGMKNAMAMAFFAGEKLNIPQEQVLVASTGVIGEPLDIEKIKIAVPDLVKNLSYEGATNFAESILTTDTIPKIVTLSGEYKGKTFCITAIAKGAGMICPNMATLLCFVLTDIDASPEILNKCLKEACNRSFNRITVDGDTSTNDSVLLLANGLSKAIIEKAEDCDTFQNVLNDALKKLAFMLVEDGEGANKCVEIKVNGANTKTDALQIAKTVANSNLVKTALFGEDANWGRIIAAAGRAGVEFNPDKIDIWFDSVKMVADGVGLGMDAELEASKILKKPLFTIMLDLNEGNAQEYMLTCDFSLDYVKINADYRS